MDSSVSPKDEISFLRVCHHISIGLYDKHTTVAQKFWNKIFIDIYLLRDFGHATQRALNYV